MICGRSGHMRVSYKKAGENLSLVCGSGRDEALRDELNRFVMNERVKAWNPQLWTIEGLSQL